MKLAPCLLAVLLGIVVHASTLFSAEPFRAGAATSVITPEIGRDIIGGFVPSP